MDLSIQLSSNLLSASISVGDPTNTCPLGLLSSSEMGAPCAEPQGPCPLTEGLFFREMGSQLVCMGVSLLAPDLLIPVHFTGIGTGTKEAAICIGFGEALILFRNKYSHCETHKKSVVAYLHNFNADYLCLLRLELSCLTCEGQSCLITLLDHQN